MSDQRHLEQIKGREVSEPIKVEVESVVPSHGLYQPSFIHGVISNCACSSEVVLLVYETLANLRCGDGHPVSPG